MAEFVRLRGGELNAAVTSALVGIHNVHLGRGPTSVHSNSGTSPLEGRRATSPRTRGRAGARPLDEDR